MKRDRIFQEWLEGKRDIKVIHLRQLKNVTKMDVLRDVETVPWEEFLTMCVSCRIVVVLNYRTVNSIRVITVIGFIMEIGGVDFPI